MALTVNNRAISLANAFVSLANEQNYLSAIPLIRLQLDNALRFFASTLVEDSTDFASYFIDGKHIRNYKDINGNKLTDAYLAKKLEIYFKGTQDLYQEICAFIHLSDKHFFPIFRKEKTKGRSVEFAISGEGNFSLDDKINFSNTMLEVCKIVLIIVEQWKHEKIKLSKSYDEKNNNKSLS